MPGGRRHRDPRPMPGTAPPRPWRRAAPTTFSLATAGERAEPEEALHDRPQPREQAGVGSRRASAPAAGSRPGPVGPAATTRGRDEPPGAAVRDASSAARPGRRGTPPGRPVTRPDGTRE